MDESQNLRETLDVIGRFDKTLATAHAHEIAQQLTQKFGERPIVSSSVCGTFHEGLESKEWNETLQDFERLFQMKNSSGY